MANHDMNFVASPTAIHGLNLQDQDFQFPWIEFPQFAIKALQWFEDRNLRINSFRLCMQTVSDYALARELIIRAIKLGATDLTIQVRRCSPTAILFVLPNEVLESETLARLSAHECLINLRFRNKVVSLPYLKSLSLFQAITFDGDLFFDLISKCPSIKKIKLDCTVSWRLFQEQRQQLCASCELIGFDNLKSLELLGLASKDSIYRHDLWPKFPWLKELVIWDHNSDYDWKGLRICSPSLELITLYMYGNRITNGTFDVPNIRKFKVVGVHLPQLDEFKTSSNREWESDIQIQCDQLTISWFSYLIKLLRMLSPSRISLSVSVTYSQVDQCIVYVGDGLPIPVVEKLKISGSYPPFFSAFLTALLRSCRATHVRVDARYMGKENLEAEFQKLGYHRRGRYELL